MYVLLSRNTTGYLFPSAWVAEIAVRGTPGVRQDPF